MANRFIFIVAACFGLLAQANFVCAQCPDMNLSPPVTLLVIDRSASMTTLPGKWASTQVDAERTPWQAVRVRVEKLFEQLPAGSVVQAGLFRTDPDDDGPVKWSSEIMLDNSGQRKRILSEIDRFAPVASKGSTPLYDALLEAIDKAGELTSTDLKRRIAIVVYSDGADDVRSKPEGEAKRQQIAKRFSELVESNENVWLYYTPLVNGEAISNIIDHPNAVEVLFGFPLPMDIDRTSFVLPNASLNPEAEIRPFFCAAKSVWPQLRGKKLKFQFIADDGQSLRIETDDVPMSDGEVRIPLHITNADELKPDSGYSGRLVIEYPTIEGYQLRAPTQIKLRFQAARRPEITRLLPESGTIVPTDFEQTFALQTLQGASVLWDFGDGASATGFEVRHPYNTAGRKTVTVSVTGADGVSAEPKQIELSVIDLSVNISPIQPPVIQGIPYRFDAVIEGPIEQLEWYVDEVPYPAIDKDSFRFTFGEPGKHTVQAKGRAEQVLVRSGKVTVQTEPGPVITLESKIQIASPVSFRVIAPQGYEQIDWFFEGEEAIRDGGDVQAKTFRVLGKQTVRAEVVYPGDRKLVAKLEIVLTAVPPKPIPKIKIRAGQFRLRGSNERKFVFNAVSPPLDKRDASSQLCLTGRTGATITMMLNGWRALTATNAHFTVARYRLLESMYLIAESGVPDDSQDQPATEIESVENASGSGQKPRLSVFPMRRGQLLDFYEKSTGDYQSMQWRFRRVGNLPDSNHVQKDNSVDESDWRVLEPSEQTLQIPEEGLYELELSVLPYAERGGDPQPVRDVVKIVVLPPEPWWLNWIACLVFAIVAIAGGYLLAYRNGPEGWNIRRSFEEIKGQRGDSIVNRGTTTKSRWSLWHKRHWLDLSDIPIGGVDDRDNFWRRGEGAPHYVKIEKKHLRLAQSVSDVTVTYSGATHAKAKGRVSSLQELCDDQHEQFKIEEPRIGSDGTQLFLQVQKISAIPWKRYLQYFLLLVLVAGALLWGLHIALIPPEFSSIDWPT